MTRSDVRRSCRTHSLAQLKAFKPDAAPWKATLKLGRDGGAGYSFKASTLREMAGAIYDLMKADQKLAEIKDRFSFPPGFPADDMLDKTVTQFRSLIVDDVCYQAGVQPEPEPQ